MRLNILSQIINHYHDFVTNYSDDPRNDFSADESVDEVEDPLGGEEGVTQYDNYNLDQDFYRAN